MICRAALSFWLWCCDDIGIMRLCESVIPLLKLIKAGMQTLFHHSIPYVLLTLPALSCSHSCDFLMLILSRSDHGRSYSSCRTRRERFKDCNKQASSRLDPSSPLSCGIKSRKPDIHTSLIVLSTIARLYGWRELPNIWSGYNWHPNFGHEANHTSQLTLCI